MLSLLKHERGHSFQIGACFQKPPESRVILACIANPPHSVFQHRQFGCRGKSQKMQAVGLDLSKGFTIQHRDLMSVKREKLEESGGRGCFVFGFGQLRVVLDQAQLLAVENP